MSYIARETALQIIDNYAKTVSEDGKVVVDAIRDIVEVITPTADVAEVRHGEWVFGKLGGRDAWVCSLCGAGFTGENAEWIAKEHDFCPKCGAKMDGERRKTDE